MHTLAGRYLAFVALCSIDKLASGKGLCCSFADGVSVQDVDWDTQGSNYRVRINGQWVVGPTQHW